VAEIELPCTAVGERAKCAEEGEIALATGEKEEIFDDDGDELEEEEEQICKEGDTELTGIGNACICEENEESL
jgi:hypothetical protein